LCKRTYDAEKIMIYGELSKVLHVKNQHSDKTIKRNVTCAGNQITKPHSESNRRERDQRPSHLGKASF